MTVLTEPCFGQMPRGGAGGAPGMPSSSGLPPGLSYPGFPGQEFVSQEVQLSGLNSLHPWNTSVNIGVSPGAHPNMTHHK